MADSDDLVLARRQMEIAAKDILAPQFFAHTVIFARTPLRWDGPPGSGQNLLVGSGTLVQVDAGAQEPHYAVLTCAHVLAALDRPVEDTLSRSLTLIIPYAGAGPDRSPFYATLPYLRNAATIEGSNNSDGTGPDLAWLPLSAEQAVLIRSHKRSRAVFFNLTAGLRTFDAFKGITLAHQKVNPIHYIRQSMYTTVGWNHEIHERSHGLRGGIWMTEVLPTNFSSTDGWLYSDFRIDDNTWAERTFSDGTKIPTTWEGLSGGSVWHIWRPDPTADLYEKMLVGVPFYQTFEPDPPSTTIRAHVDLSLLRLLHKAGAAPPDIIAETDILSALRDLSNP